MNVVRVSDRQDARIQAFLDLPLRKAAMADREFVAEGRLVVDRMLRSQYHPTAILVAESKLPLIESLWNEVSATRANVIDCPVYCVSDHELNQAVGFQFHSGIMASGLRETPTDFRQRVEGWYRKSEGANFRETLLMLPSMNSAENLGSIIRSAVGLGASGMILSPQSADPLSRRVLRVSMGHALYFPFHVSQNWLADLQRLRNFGFKLIGFENHPQMQMLANAPRYSRQILVFGNEFAGLTTDVLQLMDDIVGIPMHSQVDSLNVSVAAAIALYHYGDSGLVR